MALAEGDTLTAADLPPELQEHRVADTGPWITLEDRERDYIRKVLNFTRYNISETARILDLPRTTLWRKMKKYELMRTS